MARIIGRAAETVDGQIVLSAWLRLARVPNRGRVAGSMPTHEGAAAGYRASTGAIAGSMPAHEMAAAGYRASTGAIAGSMPAHEDNIAAEIQATTLVVDTFLTSGTWDCPAGVTEATVECWGAGGGSVSGVSGGGGGAYALSVVAVSEGSYSVVVGTSANDTDGEDTTFDATTVVAAGGKSSTNGGAGGLDSASTGDVVYSGGNTSAGSTGGGSAGDAGAAAIQNAGETNGATGSFTVGLVPGGGAGKSATTAGARGEVRITYEAPVSSDYPQVLARAWGSDSGATTSHAITMPTGIEAGDLLLAIYGCDGGDDGTDHQASVGWERLLVDSNSTVVTGAVFYKVAEGSDTLTVTTDNSEDSSHVVYRIANAGTPVGSITNSNSSLGNPPSLSPGGSDTYLWIAALVLDSGNGQNITAYPSNFGSLVTQPSHRLNHGVYVASCERRHEASSLDPGFYSHTTEQWVAATIAIPPAA